MDGYGPGGGPPGTEDGAPLAPAPARPWSLPRALIVLVVSFLLAGMASAAVGVVIGVIRLPPRFPTASELFVITVVQDGVLVAAVLGLGAWLLHMRPADLGLRPPTSRALRLATGAAGALWLLATAVEVGQATVLGPHPQALIVALESHSGPVSFGFDLVTAAVIAPFAEELFYRGLLFGAIAQRASFPVAAAISGVLFGIAHGPAAAIPISVLGIGLAYVYHRTGTIAASMATHGLVNAVEVVALYALARS